MRLLLLLITMQVPVARSTRVVAVFAPQRPGFEARQVHVGFVMDQVAMGQVLPRVLLSVCFPQCSILIHLSSPSHVTVVDSIVKQHT